MSTLNPRTPSCWEDESGARHIARYLADVNGGYVTYRPRKWRTWAEFLWALTLVAAGALLCSTAVTLTKVIVSWIQ